MGDQGVSSDEFECVVTGFHFGKSGRWRDGDSDMEYKGTRRVQQSLSGTQSAPGEILTVDHDGRWWTQGVVAAQVTWG